MGAMLGAMEATTTRWGRGTAGIVGATTVPGAMAAAPTAAAAAAAEVDVVVSVAIGWAGGDASVETGIDGLSRTPDREFSCKRTFVSWSGSSSSSSGTGTGAS